MKENIFNNIEDEKGLFKDESYLYPDYLPERLPNRDKEIDEIASCLKPLCSGKKGRNLFLSGPTGVGKTACVKYVLRELEEYTSKAKGLYINCFQINSRYGILAEIINFLGYAFPRRGLSADEANSKIKEAIVKIGFKPIIVLDEFDRTMVREEGSRVLYDLLRITEHNHKGFTIVLISNDRGVTARLDDRVRSSLMAEEMVFEAYTPAQLKEILKERGENAFWEIDKEVIALAAAHSAKLGGDARIAIESLLVAGRIAEKEGTALKTLHLKNAFETVDAASALKAIPYLEEKEEKMLRIIAENGEITSGKLYEEFGKTTKLKERTMRQLLESLVNLNIVKTETVEMGNKGKTKKITTKAQSKAVLEKLGK